MAPSSCSPFLLLLLLISIILTFLPHHSLSDQQQQQQQQQAAQQPHTAFLLPGMPSSDFPAMGGGGGQAQEEQELQIKGVNLRLEGGVMRVAMKHREAHPAYAVEKQGHGGRGESARRMVQGAVRRDRRRLQAFKQKVEAAAAGSPKSSSQAPKAASADSADSAGSPKSSSQAPKAASAASADSADSAQAQAAPASAPEEAAAAAAAEGGGGGGIEEALLWSEVESGLNLGSGEYFAEVEVGTPAMKMALIVDTGSDLIWAQCEPCERCYEQEGPVFTPNASASYEAIPRAHPSCGLVYDPEEDGGAAGQCRYSYWYGDRSNTTGSLASETFTLGRRAARASSSSSSELLRGVVFGCGHSNQGLFRGAAGVLGLGRGPLSFPSQLLRLRRRVRHRHRHRFSYCLVPRASNASVSSLLTFGHDPREPPPAAAQFTRLVPGPAAATFYYLDIASVSVGGRKLAIPASAWAAPHGGNGGGTILDSGTTLTYFLTPAFLAVSQAFSALVPYPPVDGSPWNLPLCFNVSAFLPRLAFPALSLAFSDGALLSPPADNYFLPVDPASTVYCLALLEAPPGSISILGNLLQQNFHVVYDLDEERVGFAPADCASASASAARLELQS